MLMCERVYVIERTSLPPSLNLPPPTVRPLSHTRCACAPAPPGYQVSANEKSTGRSEQITIKAEKGRLSDEEIEKMVREEEENREKDKEYADKVGRAGLRGSGAGAGVEVEKQSQ
eukprot:1687957-Pleurochrysis_carterae.AAC.1